MIHVTVYVNYSKRMHRFSRHQDMQDMHGGTGYRLRSSVGAGD